MRKAGETLDFMSVSVGISVGRWLDDHGNPMIIISQGNAGNMVGVSVEQLRTIVAWYDGQDFPNGASNEPND